MEGTLDQLALHLALRSEYLGRCYVNVSVVDSMTFAAWYIACHFTQKN